MKEKDGAESLLYARELWQLGYSLLQRKNWAEAESALRECLPILQKQKPDALTTFNTQSLIGAALLGQKKYADAEPLLKQGYTGMKEREAKMPTNGLALLIPAVERLVQLYDAWGQPDQAAKWRKELEAERGRQKK